MVQPLRFLLLALLCVLLIPLIPLIAILVIVLIIGSSIRAVHAWMYVRWNCWRSGNWCYLVCSRRRGWNEFIINNLVPALPPDIEPIWTGRRDGYLHSVLSHAVVRSGFGTRKPYLAQVGRRRIQARSLHEQLLSFKAFGSKNKEVQHLVHELLQQERGR